MENMSYQYKNYIPDIEKANIMPVSRVEHISYFIPENRTFYVSQTASSFMEEAEKNQSMDIIDDFAGHKLEQKKDRTDLVLREIYERYYTRCGNLKSLYDDLLQVSNWRLERPFPDMYAKDRTWSELNRMEFVLHEQVRRERKDFSKDTSFMSRDLRESLLEFKLQNRKNQMLDIGGLEHEIKEFAADYDGF
ncbi:MAG: hypothetical protein JRC89_13110 [Deltaproteobacteria bacterium]|nr:hypothetical protein [Deltaproteobacteria bacterium]